MSKNPWGDSPIAGYEDVSDIELEKEIQSTLLKEQGDLIEFVTAKEIQATLDDMLIGKSFREGNCIVATTPIGDLKVFAPGIESEWVINEELAPVIALELSLRGIIINDKKPLEAINKAFSFGQCELDPNGQITFKAVIDFSKGITDFDLRIILRDIVDYARALFKRIEIQVFSTS